VVLQGSMKEEYADNRMTYKRTEKIGGEIIGCGKNRTMKLEDGLKPDDKK